MTADHRADGPPPAADSGRSLHTLLAEVHRTREAQREKQRQPGIQADKLAAARLAALQALEEYAAALEELRWPVPRQIQQDLQLHRSLCNPDGARLPGGGGAVR